MTTYCLIPHSVRAAETAAEGKSVYAHDPKGQSSGKLSRANKEAMADTAESIKEYGVLFPAIARPREDGGDELVAGLETMPVIVRDLDDDFAVIMMVDSVARKQCNSAVRIIWMLP